MKCKRCKDGFVEKWPNGHPIGNFGYDWYCGGGGLLIDPCPKCGGDTPEDLAVFNRIRQKIKIGISVRKN